MGNPVHCASQAWVTAANELLEAMVAELGSSDHAFSVCEIFTDARKSVSATGKAAWHFFIEGQSVKVGLGEAEGTYVTIRADYQTALRGARLVYTRETPAELAKQPPSERPVQVIGVMSSVPNPCTRIRIVRA